MNTKRLFLLCFIMSFLLPDADGWRVRLRRIRVRKILKPICKVACKVTGCSYVMVNQVAKYICNRACNKVCSKIGDEPLMQDEAVFEDPMRTATMSFVVPQPWKMSLYDTNKDGRISRAEFRAKMPKSDRGVDRIFDAQDFNGDHYLDCDEFKRAKLDFYEKPQC